MPPTSRVLEFAGLLALLFVLALLLMPVLSRPRINRNLGNCKNNLKQLGIAAILYRDNQGHGELPAHDGSDFLLALYLAGVTTEPDLYLCFSTGDSNDDGRAIAFGATTATSYAGSTTVGRGGLLDPLAN